LEYVVISIFLGALFLIINEIRKKEFVVHEHILLALLIAIPGELCFTLYKDMNSFYYIAGHILRFVSYYYLFKGTFISAVTYPYWKMERAFNQSEKKFEYAFEYMSIGMAIVDVEGRWQRVNPSLCSMIGYSEDELMKIPYQKIICQYDLSTPNEGGQQLKEGKIKCFELQKKVYHKLGYLIWVNINCAAIRDNNGNPLYFIAHIQDITDVKRANESLEHDKLKTEFFANISHEFRTPINIIFCSLQLMEFYIKSGLDKVKVNKQVSVMRQNCYRLIRLVDNLIDATKIDTGFCNLNMQNCDIVNIIENIVLSTSEYVKCKGKELQFDTDIEEKIIACDTDRIERIMLNLLSNAVKFTPQNGQIIVNLHDEGEFINIAVKDNGIGIEKNQIPVIFDRLRQVDKSLRRECEGSGIGLSIVKSIVEMHGGTVTVNSVYGSGSEFVVRLPAKTADDGYETNDMMKKDIKCDIQSNRVEKIHIEFSDVYFLDK